VDRSSQRGWARHGRRLLHVVDARRDRRGRGAWHAIVGTLIITGLTTLMSVPFGLFTAIYLVEYGQGRLAKAITGDGGRDDRHPVDRLCGLFAYALFVLWQGPGRPLRASPAPSP
jgi:hypothetical protein